MNSNYDLRRQVAQELNVSEKELIWSSKSANPKTMYHNKELNTVSFREHGYWVLKI